MTCPVLTDRQHRALILTIRLDSRKAAAAQLGVSSSTVRDHVALALDRLGVDSLAKAAVVLVAHGWADPADLGAAA
jgi:DNA-binding NarL/FixJ family response regulator